MAGARPLPAPDCHGAFTQLIEGKLIRYRCHTGHAYTISALLSEVTGSVESMLYQLMRGLEEIKRRLHNLGMHFMAQQQLEVTELFFQKTDQTGQQARVVHESILQQEALSGNPQFEHKKLS
ncbi:hypothetical protein [Hymenobacter lapidiphilus]|uniref:hypothetical protein n=1 Tax=Hymenobacter sp. CCM 8763 TaxID=2303334 RepID=UPI00167D9546|nr:hypothetical protein [Hymenobacter sp. CCM 8763]